MTEKEFLEQRVKKDYGINVEFPEAVKPTDEVYVQIYAQDSDVKSCTELDYDKEHNLELRKDGFYTCPDCGRVFEKLDRTQPKRVI